MLFDQGAHEGMADFVVSNQALAAAIGERFALHAGDDAIDGIVDFGIPGSFFAAPGRENRGLIEQVG